MIKFSVIIPTYNRELFIKKAVVSVLKQSYTNFEIIVVDDGSTDNTKDVLADITDERFKYYLKPNEERGAARNFGAAKSNGGYVNFFDSDDLLYPNHLEEALKLINEKSSPEVFHLWYDLKYPNNITKIPNVPANVNDALLKGNCLSCNGVFIRKDIAVRHSFVEDRKLAASEDYLLWLQLAARYVFYNSPIVTSSIIQHGERSVLTVNAKALIERKKLMLKYLFEDSVSNKVYKSYKSTLTADACLMIALHLALIKTEKKKSIAYLLRSLRCDPKSVTKRQFWGTVKHIII
jgi:glycosyltransferase involved in cell wall biosynthesis